MHPTRPALFDLGLLLTALHTGLWLTLTLLGGLLVGMGAGLASLMEPSLLLPAALAGSVAGVIVACLIAAGILTLYACYRSHLGSRGWTWVLLGVSVLGLLDAGLLSTPTRLITIVGIAQMLDRERVQVA